MDALWEGSGLVMEGFLGKEEDLKCYLVLDREPVEVVEDRSDVIIDVLQCARPSIGCCDARITAVILEW